MTCRACSGFFLLFPGCPIEPARIGRDPRDRATRERVRSALSASGRNACRRRRRPRTHQHGERQHDGTPNLRSASTPGSGSAAADRAVGHHGHLHVAGEVHDALHRGRGEPRAERPRLLPGDEDLCDAVKAGEVHDGLRDVGHPAECASRSAGRGRSSGDAPGSRALRPSDRSKIRRLGDVDRQALGPQIVRHAPPRRIKAALDGSGPISSSSRSRAGGSVALRRRRAAPRSAGGFRRHAPPDASRARGGRRASIP